MAEGIITKYGLWNFKSKDTAVNYYIRKYLALLTTVFKYDNVPDTLDTTQMELMLLGGQGNTTIAEYKDKLYAFNGGVGGPVNAYGFGTKSIVANAGLNFSKEFTIDEDCIVIYNNSIKRSLISTLRHWATLLVETELSLSILTINSRASNLIVAADADSKRSAENWQSKLEAGESAILSTNAFIEGLQVSPYGEGSNKFKDLIELEQYIKSSLLQDIGLSVGGNYNLKSQYVSELEVVQGSEVLEPVLEDMLRERLKGIEKVNKMFNTNITVQLAQSWTSIRDTNGNGQLEDEEVQEAKEVEEDDGPTDNS